MGGAPTPAVGLGFGDVVVVEVLKELLGPEAARPREGFAVGYMFDAQREAAVTLATRLRNEGRPVGLALAPQKPKAFFARAGAGTSREAVFIGPDDVAAGRARLKNLDTREEREIPL